MAGGQRGGALSRCGEALSRAVVGAEVVNASMAELLKRYAFREAPYPNTRDFLAILREEAGPRHEALIVDLFETITLWDVKTTAAKATKRPDGRWVSVEGAPLSQGGWVTVYTDITETKRHEAMLRARSEELSSLVLDHAERLSAANRELAAMISALQEA